MKPEEFFTKQQLARYNYAVALGNKLKRYQEQGYFLVDTCSSMHKDWGVEIREKFDENCWDVVVWTLGNCRFVIVDIEWYDDGRPWIPSKKEIKAAFNELTIVNPKDVKRF